MTDEQFAKAWDDLAEDIREVDSLLLHVKQHSDCSEHLHRCTNGARLRPKRRMDCTSRPNKRPSGRHYFLSRAYFICLTFTCSLSVQTRFMSPVVLFSFLMRHHFISCSDSNSRMKLLHFRELSRVTQADCSENPRYFRPFCLVLSACPPATFSLRAMTCALLYRVLVSIESLLANA